MRKNLKVSAVAGVCGVCLIGGILALQPKTEPQQEVGQVNVVQDTQYEELDSEEVEKIVLDGDLEVVSNPDYDRQLVDFKLRQYENGDLSENELKELKDKYGDLVSEIQAEHKAQEEEVSEPTESSLVTSTYSSNEFISYSCDESLIGVAQTYVDKVPSGVLNAISSIGYQMKLVEDPAKEVGYDRVWCGVTSPSTKTIYIQANESKFRRAIVHEIGHAFCDYLGNVAVGEEFTAIYNEEANSFVVHDYVTDYHFKADVKEYFAEACQEYVYHPSELQSNTPRTYEFVKRYIEEVQ